MSLEVKFLQIFFIFSSLYQKPPWITKFVPIRIAQWPFLGLGAGPEHSGLDQAIIYKSRMCTSLKKSVPFQPPKITILVPPTKFAEWSNLATGAPPPSGP